ncbi:MAG: ribonuclease R [Nitrospinae bacterium]|nr:ribonuclease R [Nitrospinota bacterium]
MKTITEKEILHFFEETANRPMSSREMLSTLHISTEERPALRKLLKQMSKDGLLIKLKKGRYGLPSKMKLVTGRVQGHPDGFGFVISEEEGQNDLFINPRRMREAMHGDRLMCRIEHTSGDKSEGSIVRVIERGQKTLVGIFDRTARLAYITPMEKRLACEISIPNKQTGGAKRGEAVVVEITSYPTKHLPPEGKVVEVLGSPDDPEIEIEMIIRKNGLPRRFPSDAAEEARKIPAKIPEEEIQKRLDLRKKILFTIDGETAKDFDDAVSLEKKSNGNYALGVHIADVSHYVRPGSPLDREALERGTSVYFPDRVIPMLPKELSNEICSLKPREDRLTLSCIMEFDPEGNRLKYELKDTVINSAARLTYAQVAGILEPEKIKVSEQERAKWKKELGKIWDCLFMMKELALLLNKNRVKNGSVDFDLPESDIILDLCGKIENIVKSERNIAHRIIEEFMLSANVSVAEFLSVKKANSIYRVHESPSQENILSLREFVHNFGYPLPAPPEFTAKDLQGLLAWVQGKPEEKLINHVALRSMKQAVYSTENIGHFCLAFPFYTHFTSPIRRYPDLIVHRLARKHKIAGKASKKDKDVSMKNLEETAKLSSEMARRAEEAEREVVKLKKVQFMLDKAGEEYMGFITGVTSFGLFVELVDLFVEGLIHVSSMSDDYYIYQEKNHLLIGERRKKVYRLCDQVRVRVANVSVEKLRIDFELV